MKQFEGLENRLEEPSLSYAPLRNACEPTEHARKTTKTTAPLSFQFHGISHVATGKPFTLPDASDPCPQEGRKM